VNRAFGEVVRAAPLVAALVLLVGTGCDGRDEAQAEVARLTAELGAVRQERDGLTRDNEALKADIAQLGARNDALQGERDAIQKQLEELRTSAASAVRTQRPPAGAAALESSPPGDEDRKLLRQARQRMENLAAALFALDQLDAARSVALTALQLGSKRPETLFQIACCDADAGDYEAAVKHYERAVAALEGPQEADQELLKKCLSNGGAAAARLGDARKAEQLYLRALALDPGYAPASFNLGLLYADQPERADDAVRALQDHIVHGGSRGTSARELILKIQQAQEAAEPSPAE